MKKLILMLTVLCFSLNLSAAGRVFTDDMGRKVHLKHDPHRVISMAPSITEIIFALGQEKNLVGRTNFCDYPAGVKKIASVGNLIDPSLEKIVSLDPDVVIVSTHFTKENIQKLEKLGITVAALFSEDSFSGLYEILSKTGDLLGCRKKADEIISQNKKRVSSVLKKVYNGKRKVTLYYAIGMGKGGDFTAPGSSAIGKFIKMAGAMNVAENLNGWKYSLEQLITKDPDIIVCPKAYGYKQMFYSLPGYKKLKAVKSGNVYEIDNNQLDRLTPRTAEGLDELISIINRYKKSHA
jgi:iron complex transport system substrate-binding protein